MRIWYVITQLQDGGASSLWRYDVNEISAVIAMMMIMLVLRRRLLLLLSLLMIITMVLLVLTIIVHKITGPWTGRLKRAELKRSLFGDFRGVLTRAWNDFSESPILVLVNLASLLDTKRCQHTILCHFNSSLHKQLHPACLHIGNRKSILPLKHAVWASLSATYA